MVNCKMCSNSYCVVSIVIFFMHDIVNTDWNSLEKLLLKVEEANFAGLEKEIILVDDFSTDGTKEILKNFEITMAVFTYFASF